MSTFQSNMNWKHILVIVVIIFGLWWLTSSDNTQTGSSELSETGDIGTDVGDSLPSFEYTTIDGDRIDSESLKGKVVLITSSAYWCSTCVVEAQNLAEAYKSFDPDDVYFLTIDIDPRSSASNISQFQLENNTPWDYTTAAGGSDVINALNLSRFEITYVVNADGVITYKDSHITSSQEAEDAIKFSL